VEDFGRTTTLAPALPTEPLGNAPKTVLGPDIGALVPVCPLRLPCNPTADELPVTGQEIRVPPSAPRER